MRGLILIFILCACCGFTKNGTTYTTDGTQSDVEAAIADASNGDGVFIPSGSFTWGASANSVTVSKKITLYGNGTNSTFILLSPSGPAYGSGTISISAAGTVSNFCVIGTNSGHVTAFSTGTANGWRISAIHFIGGTDEAYFVYAGTYGLIDNCTVIGGSGSSELIFGRGPTDSWQTATESGTTNAVYIEDCTFGGSGYVCDANSNARFVVRFCTITGAQKIDGHGLASNSPARGVRWMEVYGNRWTYTNLYWTGIELRGGSGMVFSNIAEITGSGAWFLLNEYGSLSQWANFSSVYQTPSNYPVADQIGVGIDPKSAASEPMYIWNNIKNGSEWSLGHSEIPAAAITQYGGTNWTMADIITRDREYFHSTNSFNGSSGIGSGTLAAMNAITPTLTSVGWWATDVGVWNTRHSGTDGLFYKWNGSDWSVYYTPLQYPHPLISGLAGSSGVSNISRSIIGQRTNL